MPSTLGSFYDLEGQSEQKEVKLINSSCYWEWIGFGRVDFVNYLDNNHLDNMASTIQYIGTACPPPYIGYPNDLRTPLATRPLLTCVSRPRKK